MKSKNRTPRPLLSPIRPTPLPGGRAALLALALCCANAHADTYTWTPTAAGPFNWDNASSQNNWGTGAGGTFANAIGDVANVVRNISAAQTINLNQNITLGSLTIGDSASSWFQSTIEANGGSLTFNNGDDPAVLAKGGGGNGSNVVIINAPVTVVGTLRTYVTANGRLELHGALTGSNTAAIEGFASDTDSRRIHLKGDISGFEGTFRFTQSATSDAFNFTGTTAASYDGSKAKFELSGSTTWNTTTNTRIVTENGATFKMGSLSGSGGVIQDDLNSDVAGQGMTLEVGHLNTNSAWSGLLSDQRSGNGSTINFTKVGDGILDLKGDNTYHGATNVSEGTLLVNGVHQVVFGSSTIGDYTVAADATLGGGGTINSTVDLSGTISAGGSVTGDVFADSAATLTLGNLILQNGASAFFQLDAADPDSVNNDLLVILGTLTGTGGTVTIDVEAFGGGLLTGEDTWTLATYGDLDGTLPTFVVNGVDPGYLYSVDFLSEPGSVLLTLTAVPEPSVPLLAGLAAMCFWTRRRRKP